jgi:hypothetical protein
MSYVTDQYRSGLVLVEPAGLHDQVQRPAGGGEHPDAVERALPSRPTGSTRERNHGTPGAIAALGVRAP